MIVGILGFIGSGKGTVADRLVKCHGFRQDSFASSLKDACSHIFGWRRDLLEGDTKESRKWREEPDLWWAHALGRPGFSPRQALQLMGTDVIRNGFDDRIWLLSVLSRYQQNSSMSVVISDVRFANEVEFIRNNGGHLIQVIRGDLPEWYNVAAAANAGDVSAGNEMISGKYSKIHRSEWEWVGTEASAVIYNNGTLADLHKSVDELVKTLKK